MDILDIAAAIGAGAREISLNAAALDDPALLAFLGRKVQDHIAACWVLPPGAVDAGYVVTIQLNLNEDGRLAALPRVNRETVVQGLEDPVLRALGDSVERAVMRCEPYDFLPAESYPTWRRMTLRFSTANATAAP